MSRGVTKESEVSEELDLQKIVDGPAGELATEIVASQEVGAVFELR